MKVVHRFLFALLGLTLALGLSSHALLAEEDDGRVRLFIRASDPDGGKLSFTWKQVDGPAIRIADPNASRLENGKWVSETYFIPTEPGRYSFEVTVKNDQGVESKKIIPKEVLPPSPAPVANAGGNKVHTSGEVVRLNGIDSKASQGKVIAEWEWRVVQAPEKFKLDPKLLKERAFDFKAVEAGVYQFELRVSDGKRWSEPSRVTVNVNKPSAPPQVEESVEKDPKPELKPQPGVIEPKKPDVKAVVKVGRQVKVGEKIILDGSGSLAPKEARAEFYWRPEKGFIRESAPDRTKPFDAERSDLLNYPVWVLTANQPGEYAWVLEITAHNKSSKLEPTFKVESELVIFTVVDDKATVPVPPKNPDVGAGVVELDPKEPKVGPKPEDPPVRPAAKKDPPLAKISAERSTVEVGDVVQLDGTQSKDPLGEKIEYIWGPVKGKRYPKAWAGVEGPKVDFKAEEEGIYGIALVVKAGERFSDPSEINIQVGPANEPPIIKLANKFECLVGEQLRIEADVHDPENDRLSVQWACIDPADLKIPDKYSQHYDAAARSSVLVFVPKNAGAYVFRIEVTDAKGRKETAQTMVGAKEVLNRVPTAKIEGPENAGVGQKVHLAGDKSSDPEKKPLRYFWKQVDGPAISAKVPGEGEKQWDFIPSEPGRYTISLMVSDGVNNSEVERFPLNVVKSNTPPAAAASVPAGGRLSVGESLVLDGGASSDPEGDQLTFKWRKTAGKGDVTLEDADKPRAKVTGTAPGEVRIELVVNDGVSDSEPKALSLYVARKNGPPVAKIGGPTAARVGDTVEFNADGSTDPDNDDLSFVWSQTSEGGPEIGARGRDLRKKSLRFRIEKPGTYVLNLEAIDAEGAKSEPVSHTMVVKGINKPPRAVASVVGGDRVPANTEVKLSGRGSLDPDGQPLSYKWVQLDGPLVQIPAVNQEVINLVVKEAGRYEFELIVNDGEVDSPPAKVSLSVAAANQPPIPIIAEVLGAEPGEKVTLDASASKDPDGDKLEFQWSQKAGPKAEFPWRGDKRSKVELKLPEDGEYVFELKVFDGKEWSEPKAVSVRTRAGNVPPVAVVARTEIRTEIGAETTLDASASNDPDKGPDRLGFVWKQIAGSRCEFVPSGNKAKFIGQKEGNYAFQVTVSDSKAASAPVQINIAVVKPGLLPVAVAEAAPNPLKAAKKGDAKDPNILILDGRRSRSTTGVLTFAWSQVSGDDLKLQPVQLAKDRVGMRIFVPGDYRFQLVVSDGQNQSQPAFVDVRVEGDRPAAVQPREVEPRPAPRVENKPAPVDEERPAVARPKAVSGESNPESQPKRPARGAPSIDEDGGTGNSSFEEPKGNNKDGALLPPPKDITPPSATATREQEELQNLAKDNDPEAEKKLIAALSSDDAGVRSMAAASLYRRGMSSIPALIGVLESGNGNAKKEAYWALRELTHEPLGQDASKWKQWWSEQGSKKAN